MAKLLIVFYPRSSYTDKIYKAFQSLPIVVLIGSRQVGKTTIMENLELDDNKIFLNGQNPEVAELFQKYSILKDFLRINLNKNIKGYLFIDEFQFIPGISTMLKLLVDEHKELKIMCTGSSSLDILQKVEESLAGRVRIIEVFSLSFEEYLLFSDSELHKRFKKYDIQTPKEIIDKQIPIKLNEYLLYGGLPRTALQKQAEEKIEILDDIYRTYLLRDVRSFVRNEDTVGFNKMLRLLASQIGSMVNVNELSISSGLSYKKCAHYLSLLEQMFIIKLLEPFHTNKRKVVSKMQKVYFTDIGLRNLIYGSFNQMNIRTDGGSIMENFIFLEIKRKLGKAGIINYFRTHDGVEVDFVINNYKKCIAIEVKSKELSKPVFMRNMESLAKVQSINLNYVVNNSLNSEFKGFKFILPYQVSGIV
ncbi:MAG: ATP-binding protein [Bacteroidota bacterium]